MYEKPVYVWYTFCQIIVCILAKKRKELTLLESRVNSAFLVEKKKHFFCGVSFTSCDSKLVKHEIDISR